jgi:hypothetical protein
MKTKYKRRKALVRALAVAGLVAISLVGYVGNLEPSAPPGPTIF